MFYKLFGNNIIFRGKETMDKKKLTRSAVGSPCAVCKHNARVKVGRPVVAGRPTTVPTTKNVTRIL